MAFYSLMLGGALAAQGQEYKVASMTLDQMDLTARTKPRVDLNGRKCAVIKIIVQDNITSVEGNVIGEVESNGMQKVLYVTHDSRQINILFENHLPLKLVFDDYGIKAVTESMVYKIKLESDNEKMSAESMMGKASESDETAKDVMTFTVNGVNFDMVKVDGGSYLWGYEGWEDNDDLLSVEVETFYIGKTEVTQELWEAVMGDNPSEFVGKTNPVENVSWEDCMEFVGRLSRLTGRKFRLPNEYEWEYAARGGGKTQSFYLSGSNNINRIAWNRDNSNEQTHPVAQKLDNELGIYDMSGNVWEWCSDTPIIEKDDSSGLTYTYCVYRGGSWMCDENTCRITFRDTDESTAVSNDRGLRIAL